MIVPWPLSLLQQFYCFVQRDTTEGECQDSATDDQHCLPCCTRYFQQSCARMQLIRPHRLLQCLVWHFHLWISPSCPVNWCKREKTRCRSSIYLRGVSVNALVKGHQQTWIGTISQNSWGMAPTVVCYWQPQQRQAKKLPSKSKLCPLWHHCSSL